MAPSVSLLYILFTIGFLFKRSTGVPELELGINFLEEPGDVTTVKGKSLSMPCRPRTSQQEEPIQIVWYHDNRRMDLGNDRRRTIFQNGTLHFSKVVHKKTGHSDQGEYRCVAIKENGSLSSRPAYLRISSLPEVFSRHPTDQSVEAGSNVRLTCDAGHGSDVEIEWEKDETRISANPGKYAIVWKPDMHESVLYITNAGADDSGNYRCVARSLLTNKQRHSPGGLLEVVVPENERKSGDLLPLTFLSAQQSSWTLSTSVREIKEGENVTLDCVTNKYSNSILGWTFSGQDDNSTRSLVNTTKNSGCDLMVLKKVTRHQAGWYTCTALDSTDQTTRKLKFELRVLIPPEIQDMSDSIIFRTSKTVRFRCVVHGVPVPEIYWLKDGNIFNITGRIKHRTSVNESFHTRHSELIVSSTVANDAGIYECMTKNPVGWSWAASRLLLNATRPAPGAPERVSCEPISSSQIRLTWDVSNLTSEIKAFSVHYHLTDDGEEMQKVMPSNSRSIQIDKLLPFSNYTFYLRLYMDSASEFSEKAVCQTGEEVPTDAPEKKLQIITQNSVYVSWIPLKKEKARGVITKYKIQWRNTKSPSSRVAEVTGNVLSYTITGLDPGKKYDVRILAATSKGFPHSDLPWETFEIPTDFTEFNSNIPSPPKVTLEALNSSGIEVKWKLPNKESKVIGYKIFYRKLNSDQVGPIIVPPNTNKYVVAGLEPETWYEIMVLGFTQEDDGESGAGFIHTLSNLGSPSKVPAEFSTIPEPPLSLEADPISPVAINLTWKVPQTPPGFNSVKHYTVCFNPVQTSSNKNVTVTCMKSLENKISIVGLHPYTLYEFKVKTHGLNDQQSVFSQVMECHTLEGVPSQVTDINWKPINKTVVQVSWKEPRHANGILKSYTVSYTDDANLPLESWNAKIVSSATCETQLTHLSSNVNYYLIIRASTNAGLGAYAPPKQIFILSKSVARNKPSDHYIGIVVGLGIGIFCIIICTTCILCRRRCLKRQVSQEFEVPSCRQSNGSSCQRDREMTAESRETEYFTFLSSQREPPNSLEITVRHLDAKGNYSNGSANGIKMSLLGESRTPKDGLGKTGLYLNEKSRSDRSTSESPLLMCKIEGNVHRGGDGADLIFYGYRHNQQESSTPLLLTGRRKRSGSTGSSGSENIDFEPESCSKVKRTSPGSKRLEPARKRTDGLADADTERRQVYTQCDQSNLSSILENPEFRFSTLSSEYVNRNCGYARQSFLYNGYNGETNDDGNETEVDCSIFQESKLPLHFVSKEIVQES